MNSNESQSQADIIPPTSTLAEGGNMGTLVAMLQAMIQALNDPRLKPQDREAWTDLAKDA